MNTVTDRDHLDELPSRTILIRTDEQGPLVAQKLGQQWFEAGVADPFDEGCYREWVGATIADPEADAENHRLGVLADTLYDRLMQVAGFVVAAHRTGETSRAIAQITALVTSSDLPTPAHPQRLRTVLCPTCEGSGWETHVTHDGHATTHVCRTCGGGDSIHIGA